MHWLHLQHHMSFHDTDCNTSNESGCERMQADAQAELRARTKQLKALLSELNMEAAVTEEKKYEVARLQVWEL